MEFSALSTLLFTPGTATTRFERGYASGADGIVLDLEDAVGPQDKEIARTNVFEWLKFKKNEVKEKDNFCKLICIRINSLESPSFHDDNVALIDSIKEGFAPDLVLIPKVESPQLLLNYLDTWKTTDEVPVGVVALIESARGIYSLDEICKSSSKIVALGFGGADLSADLRCAFDYEALLYFRSQMVLYSSLYKLALWDVPYLDLKNSTGLIEETNRIKKLGFTGKFSIHPDQVKLIQNCFIPTINEIEWAKEIIYAFNENKGGVFSFQGRMVDEPVVMSAKRVLARAKIII